LIVEARKDGLFTSPADFAARVNPRAINKRVIESLAAAGAFEVWTPIARGCSQARRQFWPPASAAMRRRRWGRTTCFGGAADAPTIMLPQVEPWLPAERLRREYTPSASSSPAIRSTITRPH